MSDDEIDILEEAADAAKTAQEFGKIGALNLLLGPSAKVLGEHWAKKISAKISEVEQKNLQDHLQATQDLRIDPEIIEVSPQKVGALIEWTVSAKKINQLEAPDLAKAWQKALVELLRDNYELLSSLTKMNERVLEHFKRGGEIPPSSFDELKEIGLMDSKKVLKFWPLRESGILFPVLGTLIVSGTFDLNSNLLNTLFYIVIFCLLTMGTFFVGHHLPKVRHGELTLKGRYLYESLCKGKIKFPDYFSK